MTLRTDSALRLTPRSLRFVHLWHERAADFLSGNATLAGLTRVDGTPARRLVVHLGWWRSRDLVDASLVAPAWWTWTANGWGYERRWLEARVLARWASGAPRSVILVDPVASWLG